MQGSATQRGDALERVAPRGTIDGTPRVCALLAPAFCPIPTGPPHAVAIASWGGAAAAARWALHAGFGEVQKGAHFICSLFSARMLKPAMNATTSPTMMLSPAGLPSWIFVTMK